MAEFDRVKSGIQRRRHPTAAAGRSDIALSGVFAYIAPTSRHWKLCRGWLRKLPAQEVLRFEQELEWRTSPR
ncbi:hypothetical protein [Rhizorhabdus wittichii]|jgi:hypothetical protein|uniref:hypothetical protein n=1 Tax=Rhizorhabdus wittichii TaxID=160791 RepID=UPI0013051A37|nr:hypothetical protein [Rhizorhabdus wittichii]